MKRTFGKLITMLLCLTMLVSLLPATALAAPSLDSITDVPGMDNITDKLPSLDDIGNLPGIAATPVPADPTGACGTSMHWHLSGGTLTISGNGAMFDWNGSEHAPWYAYRGNIKTVVVEMGVPSIGAYAFDGLTNLTAIELPASIERIGNYAFESCVKLADITLPDSITEIGVGAFENCTALTKVILPANIHKAADSLFKGCTSLTEVIFPVGETELGASVFDGCAALNMVVYHDVTKIGTGAFRGCTKMTVFNFPDTLTEIGKDAFSGSGLKLVKLPKGLTTVDFLGGTDKLITVFIPASVKTIEMGQFADCEDLKFIDYEGSKLDWKNIRIEANNDMLKNAEFTYNITGNLQYAGIVELPATPTPTAAPTPTPVATVKPDLPNAESISGTCGEKAMWNLGVTNGILTISGEGAMEEYAYDNDGHTEYPWYNYRKQIKSIVVEEGITSFGDGAFAYCEALETVTIPDSITAIGNATFAGCTSLTAITIPKNQHIIPADLFHNCSALSEIALHENVTTISRGAFAGCTALKELYIPKSVKVIDVYAFLNCDQLTDIYYGGSEAEWQKLSANELNIPLTNATIHYNCTGLPVGPEVTPAPTAAPTPVVTPAPTVKPTVTPKPLIQPPYDCPDDVCGPNAKWSFDEATGTLTITGEGDMYSYFGRYPAWNRFSDKITTVVIEEGITSIGENVFGYCVNVETMAIPATVTYIGIGAFTDCDALCDVFYAGSKADWENVTIEDKLDSSFYGNSNILKAYIHYNSNGIVDLPTYTPNSNQPGGECGPNAVWNFNTNSGLLTIKGRGPVKSADWSKYNSVIREIVIEEGITAFDRVSFGDCSSLKKMKLADSIFFIGYTFAPRTTLESFNLPASLRYYFGSDIDAKNFYITDLTQYLEVFSDQQVSISHISADNTYLDGKLLTDLVIPDGITAIPTFAFRNWDSLETVTIPNSVETIGNSAFQECRNLNTVTLSENLKTLETDAFYRCSKLTSITIPASMEMAMELAFGECGLKTIIFEGNAPLMASDTFGSVKADAYYPAGNSTWTAEKKENYGGELNWIEGLPSAPTPPAPTNKPDVTPNVTPGIQPTTKPTPTVKPQPPVEPTVNPELDPETCKHTLFFVAPQDATCTEDGFTGKVICGKGCGYVLQEGKVKPALGHKYKKGTCTRCGHIEGTPEPTPTPIPAGDTPFVDMTENDWFYEPVRWAVQNGITGGTSENTFSPNMTCTRAQIVTFLWAAAGKPEPTSKSPFSDVKEGDWFYKPVIWAVENDITSGTTPTTFSPNIPCSRAQVVALLYKAMQSPAVENLNNPFADVLESNYFHKAVMWALENGIASGMTAELFGSSQPCTRAQIAMFLYKAYN
ncbi:MAG: leucine-rich repeat protein [Oscillospiraceae bacterium]|nr:leucine-rich repeat protein [Oscillospiraceae bacterium]